MSKKAIAHFKSEQGRLDFREELLPSLSGRVPRPSKGSRASRGAAPKAKEGQSHKVKANKKPRRSQSFVSQKTFTGFGWR